MNTRKKSVRPSPRKFVSTVNSGTIIGYHHKIKRNKLVKELLEIAEHPF
jgi:hypothetical protein